MDRDGTETVPTVPATKPDDSVVAVPLGAGAGSGGERSRPSRTPAPTPGSKSLHRLFLLVGALVLGVGLLPAQASANGANPQTIFVDDTGTASDATTPEGSCGSPNYNTIQAAINAATAGDSVQVCAGTYVENVNVNKQLTLSGPNAGISAGWDAGTRAPEATIRGEMDVVTAGVVLDGLEFVRPDVAGNLTPKLIDSAGVTGEVAVSNSVVDLRLFGISPVTTGCGAGVYGKAAWRLRNNHFSNQRYASATCTANLYESRAVFSQDNQSFEATGNAFSNVGHAVFLIGFTPPGGTGGVIESNTFSAGQAVTVGTPTGVQIRGNSILSGNGIYFDKTTNATVENNLFCGGAGGGTEDPTFPECTARVGFSVWAQGAHSGLVVEDNAILGAYAAFGPPFQGRTLFNYGSNPVDLTDNWWGNISKSAISAKLYQNPGSLPFSPWIASYTPDDAKVGQPGFWPTEVVTGPCTTTCYVNDETGSDSNGGSSPADAFKTIQKGIDTASAGGTVIVAAGTYSDEQTGDFTDIYVPNGKDGLTVKGAPEQDVPTVELDECQPTKTCTPGSATNRQVAGVDVRSNDVTFEKMNFTKKEGNDWGPQSNFRIAANAQNPTGVQGFTLKDVTSSYSWGSNVQIQKGDTSEAVVTHSDLLFDDVDISNAGGRGIYIASNAQIVDGFTFRDSSIDTVGANSSEKQGIQAQAPVVDVSITDSTFEGVPSGGINFLSGVTGENNLIEDVTVSDTTALNGNQSGISVFNLIAKSGGGVTTAENITINRASVTDFGGRGILVGASYSGNTSCNPDGCVVDDVTVQNSTITNAGNNAVMLLAGANGTVSDTTVQGNDISFAGASGTGVLVNGNPGAVTGFDINKNAFVGGGTAVQSYGSLGTTNGKVNRNSLRAGSSGDPAIGVDGHLTSAVDATCNWWGQADGPATGQAVDANTGSGTLRFLQSAGLDSPCLGNPQPIIDPNSFTTVGSLVTLQNADSWDIPEGTGPLTLEYQWESCEFAFCDPSEWSLIPGATGATYRLTEADLGQRLRANITASNPGPGGGSATYPAADAFRVPFGPVITPSSTAERPTPEGENVQVNFPAIDNGQQISLDFGCGITEAGTTTVQSRDASQVPEAQGFRFGDPPTTATIETTAEYSCEGQEVISVCTSYDTDSLPAGTDPKLFHFVAGSWVDVTVSWDPETGILCGDVTSFSPFAVGRAAASPANTALPAISGTAKVGETLNATPGTWSGDQPITYAYQWVRCESSGTGCSNIAGASSTSYVPVAADAGKKLKVEVAATNDGGSGSATSALSDTVEAEPVPPSGDPNLRVNVSSPKKVRAGKAFKATAKVANLRSAPSASSARKPRSVLAREVETCVRLPRGTTVQKANGARLSGRSACWTRPSLAVGKSATYTVRVKVFRSASGSKTVRATASAENDVGREVRADGEVKLRILKAAKPKPKPPTG